MIFCEKSVTNCKYCRPRLQPAIHGQIIHTQYGVLMMVIILLCLPAIGNAAATGRLWSYFNLTSLVSPNWAIIAMPGMRYEFARSDDPSMLPAKGVYFYELFVGPVFTKNHGAFTFKLPLWYYYMGFPSTGTYSYSHNIEVLPILSYRFGKTTLTSRTIFHNTIYASVYDTSYQRTGYSLVVRQMLQIAHEIDERATLILADEPFFGVIADKQATPSPIGFWPKGFRLNRVYAGLQYRLTPRITVSPQYVLETVHDEGTVTDVNQYLFVTISYVLKLF